jgi:lysophospholipase L1-like esterase
VSFAIIPQIKLYMANPSAPGAHPPVLSCVKGQFPPSALVGEIFILDAAEQATLDAAVTQMNTYIQGKANELGWAYVDVNPVLTAQRFGSTPGCVNQIPNLAAAGTTSPFGSCVSFDGLHPSAAGAILIANEFAKAINAKYNTNLATQ